MNAVQRRLAVTRSLFFVLVAIVLFVLAEFVAQGWLTKGTWQEWVTAGFVSFSVAEVVA